MKNEGSNKFKPGMEIIAVLNHSGGAFRKGEKFIVEATKQGCKHSPILIDIGYTKPGGTQCLDCGVRAGNNTMWFSAECFKPVDDNELSDITIEELIAEISNQSPVILN